MLPETQKENYELFFKDNKLGIHKLDADNFGSIFVFYISEILILFAVLLHIQKEQFAGVFDVPYEQYETFEEGLLRYRLEVLCQTDEERQHVITQFSHDQVLNLKLEEKEISKYREPVYNSEDEAPFRQKAYR